MSDSEIKVKIGAETTDIISKMKEAVDAVKGSMEGISGAVEGAKSAFESIGTAVAAFTAILGGGEMFKEMISETVSATMSMEKFSNQIGVSLGEAQAMAENLGVVGMSTDEYAGSISRMTQRMKSNSAEFAANGIAVKDSTGQYRDAKIVLQETIDKVNSMATAHDKAALGLATLGRGWAQYLEMSRITNESIEETKKRQDELGITMTGEGVDAVFAYKKALVDAKEVFEAVGQRIAMELIPKLTELADWFGQKGPAMVRETMIVFGLLEDVMNALGKAIGFVVDQFTELFSLLGAETGKATDELGIFNSAVLGLELVINYVEYAFKVLWQEFSEGCQDSIAKIDTLGQYIQAAFTIGPGYADRIADVGRRGDKMLTDIAKDGAHERVKLWDQEEKDRESILKRMSDAIGGAPVIPGPDDKKNKSKKDKTGHYHEAPKAKQNQEGIASAELAKITADQDAILAVEKEKAKEALVILENKHKNNLISIQKYYDDRLKIELDLIKKEEDAKQKEINAAKKKADSVTKKGDEGEREKLQILAQVSKLQGEFNLLKQKEITLRTENGIVADRELSKQTDALTKLKAEEAASAGLSSIDVKKAELQKKLDLGEITKEKEIAMQRDLENQRYELVNQELEAEKALVANDIVAKEQIQKKEEEEMRNHTKVLADLNTQAAKESATAWLQIKGALESTFTGAILSLEQGHSSIKSILQNMVTSFLAALQQMIAAKLAAQAVMGITGGMAAAGGGIMDAIGNSSIGNFIVANSMGPLATGTNYVPQDGLAYLHKGEAVVPEKFNKPSAMGRGPVSVQNYFTLSQPSSQQTQSQIAVVAGMAINNAMKRNS